MAGVLPLPITQRKRGISERGVVAARVARTATSALNTATPACRETPHVRIYDVGVLPSWIGDFHFAGPLR